MAAPDTDLPLRKRSKKPRQPLINRDRSKTGTSRYDAEGPIRLTTRRLQQLRISYKQKDNGGKFSLAGKKKPALCKAAITPDYRNHGSDITFAEGLLTGAQCRHVTIISPTSAGSLPGRSKRSPLFLAKRRQPAEQNRYHEKRRRT